MVVKELIKIYSYFPLGIIVNTNRSNFRCKKDTYLNNIFSSRFFSGMCDSTFCLIGFLFNTFGAFLDKKEHTHCTY
tara:strand:+ start:824 stop:1051 length:228 start_codon:yes stop_codon:yes gene_type:complete